MTSADDSGSVSLAPLRALLVSVLHGPGRPFGDYVLYEKLGRGGYGVVLRARRADGSDFVALKQMRGAEHATAEERREFLIGARTAMTLEHPGIVRVRDVVESDEAPFFTMDLVEGGDLAAAIDLARPSQAQAARWLHDIALAVHHAHSREVLHRDLKPANILLDEQGRPLVTDFGSARRLSSEGNCVESKEGPVGYYMAPEQAGGDPRGVTRRADLYSLGVILYELLTGQVPYEGLAFADWVTALVSQEPVRPPRQLVPDVNRYLELICLKCLEKDAAHRYESAALLAEDLDLVLRGGRPRHVRAERTPTRALRWVRRHPLGTALMGGGALIGLLLIMTALAMFEAEREQRRSALETNAFIANSQAGALLFQLRDFADRVEHCAQNPLVRAILSADSVHEEVLDLRSCAADLQYISVMARDGRLLGRWPDRANHMGRRYDFRDYFRGARDLAEHGLSGAYLGPAYLAEPDGQFAFALAAPVFDGAGNWLGVLVGSLNVDSTIGQVRMTDSAESGRMIALLAPRGRDRDTPTGPRVQDFYFIVHPLLPSGHGVPLKEPGRAALERAFGVAAPAGEQFSLRWTPPLLLTDYRDPLLESGQSSLAAFAPVGRTGYIVVVQTSKDALARDGRALAHQLAWRAGVPLAVGALLLGLTVFSTVRRKRSLELRPYWARRRASAEARE